MICPIMTKLVTIQNLVSTEIERHEFGVVECQKEKCQWWWKCKEPVNSEVKKYQEQNMIEETNE